jgi:hypothetical protein
MLDRQLGGEKGIGRSKLQLQAFKASKTDQI